jgi:lipid-A-disaccharide synthase-like uncharacterized protein
MKASEFFIYFIGFLAQGLFGIRMVNQWVQSERAGFAVSPSIFWRTSLLASFLFLIYGILRRDAVIIFGQLLAYFIYIRNLQLKHAWHSINRTLRFFALTLPIITIGWFYSNSHLFIAILKKNDLTQPIILLGAMGQLTLNVRFVYQWAYSERRKSSLFPFGFWVISIAGSLCVIIYALYRSDPVLLIAQLLGLGVYARNIMLGWNNASPKE